MTARTRGHGDQAVCALLDRLAGELVVDDVVQHHTTIAVRGLVDFLTRAQARDDDRHLVLHAQGHVVFKPVVALVHDLVDGKRGGCIVRIGLVVGRQGLGDLGQPLVELRGRTGVERRHGADHTGLALLDHQLGVADDEQR